MLPVREKVKIVKPRALRPGDRIGLVCPASRPATPAVVARAEQLVTEMGFLPVTGKHVLSIHGFMAGTDNERLSDLSNFLSDESIAAIFCITGGYGNLHLISQLDYQSIAQAPKIVMGCDDNTALITALFSQTGLITFHGPNLDQITSKETFENLKAALTGTSTQKPLSVKSDKMFEGRSNDFYCPVEGTVEGRLLGGNLTAFVSLLGTRYQPDMDGALLFLEDVNEHNGILDRWFTTLYLSGKMQAASGVALGSFENCSPGDSVNMLSVMDTFSDRLKYLRKPSCFGLPFGQTRETNVVPVGVMAQLDCGKGILEFLEPSLT